jgi:hypothetical protein
MARLLSSRMDDFIKGCFVVGFIVFLCAGLLGWCLNIAKLAAASSDPVTGLIILRVFGIFFAPVGAVLGYV